MSIGLLFYEVLMASHEEKDLGEERNRGDAVVNKTLESNGQEEGNVA